jgi:hypothetical protein
MFLIKKERKEPFKLQMEEALARRLPQTHQKRPEILRNLKKGLAGYRGETNLDYHLSFLPDKDYFIFQDLRLTNGKKVFQLDTLVLNPSFALIIESKNIYGTLFFDVPSKQLIRTFDNQEEGFSDPIMQAERQQKQFEQWMKNHNLKPLPTESLIAIGSPSTILKTNAGQNQIFQKVLHAEHIPNKILELEKYYHCAEPILTPYLLRKICDLLLLNHTPTVPNILESYQVPKSDIITGVQCPYCHQFPMRRIYGAWSCQYCERKDKFAHKQAIQDYCLLHLRITNEECRHFLQIASSQLATRLLPEADLPFTGTRKARVYHLKLKD